VERSLDNFKVAYNIELI